MSKKKPPPSRPVPLQNLYDAVEAAWEVSPNMPGPSPQAVDAFENTLDRTPGRHDYVLLGMQWSKIYRTLCTPM